MEGKVGKKAWPQNQSQSLDRPWTGCAGLRLPVHQPLTDWTDRKFDLCEIVAEGRGSFKRGGGLGAGRENSAFLPMIGIQYLTWQVIYTIFRDELVKFGNHDSTSRLVAVQPLAHAGESSRTVRLRHYLAPCGNVNAPSQDALVLTLATAAAVPEPKTLALLIAGAALLAMSRKRR